MLLDRMTDGVHQMRLAKTYTAIDKQRIVGLSRRLRRSFGRSMCKLVAGTDDKFLERVFWIQRIFDRLNVDKIRRRFYDRRRRRFSGFKKEIHLAANIERVWRRFGFVYRPSKPIIRKIQFTKAFIDKVGIVTRHPFLCNPPRANANFFCVPVDRFALDRAKPRVEYLRAETFLQ